MPAGPPSLSRLPHLYSQPCSTGSVVLESPQSLILKRAEAPCCSVPGTRRARAGGAPRTLRPAQPLLPWLPHPAETAGSSYSWSKATQSREPPVGAASVIWTTSCQSAGAPSRGRGSHRFGAKLTYFLPTTPRFLSAGEPGQAGWGWVGGSRTVPAGLCPSPPRRSARWPQVFLARATGTERAHEPA